MKNSIVRGHTYGRSHTYGAWAALLAIFLASRRILSFISSHIGAGSMEYFNIPSSWILNEEGDGGTRFILFSPLEDKNDSFKENVFLISQDFSKYNLTVDQYVSNFTEQIESSVKDFKLISSTKLVADGKEFQKIIYTGKTKGFHSYPRANVMDNFSRGNNIALIVGRQGQAMGDGEWNIIHISDCILDSNIFYRGRGTVFTLYLYPETSTQQTLETQPEKIKGASRHSETALTRMNVRNRQIDAGRAAVDSNKL